MGFALEEQKKGHPNHRAVEEKRATKGRLHCFGVTKQNMHWGKVDGLRSGGQKKKVIPGLWKENGEKEAMKESLHCIESHEAKTALFFGRQQSGGLQGPRNRFRIWLRTYPQKNYEKP